MLQLIKSILKGVDNEASAKRTLLIWIGILVWSFVNVSVFLFYKKLGFPETLPGTIALYDFALIVSLAGLTVGERVWGKTDEPKQQP